MQPLLEVIYEGNTKKRPTQKVLISSTIQYSTIQYIPQLSSLNFHLLFNPGRQYNNQVCVWK